MLNNSHDKFCSRIVHFFNESLCAIDFLQNHYFINKFAN